ncbi:CLUMA_CG000018, isoform A, partial [Clunio marinus]
ESLQHSKVSWVFICIELAFKNISILYKFEEIKMLKLIIFFTLIIEAFCVTSQENLISQLHGKFPEEFLELIGDLWRTFNEISKQQTLSGKNSILENRVKRLIESSKPFSLTS